MRYGVFIENMPDTYIVEAEKDNLEQILYAADALGAPVFVGTIEDWEDAIRGSMEEDPDMTRQDVIDEMRNSGYDLMGDNVVLYGFFYVEPMPPNVEVGHYMDDNYRFSRFHNLKKNDGMRRVG